MGPPDPIFGLLEAFNKDPRSNKVNLTIGAYRDEQGRPYVLEVVKKVEQDLMSKQSDKEYAGIMGYPAFRKAATEFALTKDSPVIQNELYVSAQSVGGTGALSIVMDFLGKFFPYKKTIYAPQPTWGNHPAIFQKSGLKMERYRHYDPETVGFNAQGCYEDLKSIPDNSIVLFHSCGHNPSGIDPTMEEWAKLSHICKEKGHFVVMDMAYQGFATGDLAKDAGALRLFVGEGHKLAYAQSFSKNMGIYGERLGAATFVCNNKEECAAVESQVKRIIRPSYSNPPIHGARIATEILTKPEYRQEWLVELKGMADRISSMRVALKGSLEKLGSTQDWSHITTQIGMFCFTGLKQDQVDKIREDFGVFMTRDGRISVPALFPSNVDYVAQAIYAITK